MLTERFEQALIFASRAHAQQKRKGGDIPYLAHLLSVAALVLEHGGGEDEAIAALLHDAVEDQGGPAMHARIVEHFGPQVADIVQGCTDSDQTPKPPWLDRKRRYIEHAAHAPASVRLVSLCDKVHNSRCILADFRRHGPAAFDKFKAGAPGTLWYYRSLADAYRQAQVRGSEVRGSEDQSENRKSEIGNPKSPLAPLVDELDRTITELERITGIDGRTIDPQLNADPPVLMP